MSPEVSRELSEELELLISLLPPAIQDRLRQEPAEKLDSRLLEIVLDLGRPPEARYPSETVRLSDGPVSEDSITHVVARLGEFGKDNRAGIPRTLHRISAIRNRRGDVVGLTLRVGRAVYGTIDLIQDVLVSGLNILLLGRPGVGKTTQLRETARVLADQLRKRVIVIDTSNEIGGDGDVPHPAIGSARRMQVSHPDRQHSVMIEAVENHMPEVIIVDEIGTEAEALAARTIAERGIQLIGTAHGTTLENLVLNPTLSDVVGGTHTVILSDEEAARRGTQKTVNERRAPPTFDIVVELVDRDELVIHRSTAAAVDAVLTGEDPAGERRKKSESGSIEQEILPSALELEEPEEFPEPVRPGLRAIAPTTPSGITRIYPYGVDREQLDRLIRNLEIDAATVTKPEQADLVLALRTRSNEYRLKKLLEQRDLPLHVVKKDSASQLRKLLKDLFANVEGIDEDEVREAVSETEHAIHRAMNEGVVVELSPRRPPLRKMQHRIISRYHLESESVGSEPIRHLVIYPPTG